ncbi:MAG: hypothetical protein HY619_03875 [Thaumarchaeota archaeon]|nr:hypothetical protein [Nitrososphaerota archaeon]
MFRKNFMLIMELKDECREMKLNCSKGNEQEQQRQVSEPLKHSLAFIDQNRELIEEIGRL